MQSKSPTSIVKEIADKCELDSNLVMALSMSDELFPAAYEQLEFDVDDAVKFCIVATKKNAALVVAKISQEDIDENISIWMVFPGITLALYRAKKITLSQEQYTALIQGAIEEGIFLESILEESDFTIDDQLLFTALECSEAPEVISHLLKHTNVNAKQDNVPFIIAAIKKGDAKVVQLALDTNKCDLTATDDDNHDALYYLNINPAMQHLRSSAVTK